MNKGKYFRGITYEQFLLFVTIPAWDCCWLWTGREINGYGRVTVRGVDTLAHRLSYTFAYGEFEESKIIHHICLNTLCVNPRHLVALSKENHIGTLAYINSHKTHCPQGHEYTLENTRIQTVVVGLAMFKKRECLTCKKQKYKLTTRGETQNDRGYEFRREEAV